MTEYFEAISCGFLVAAEFRQAQMATVLGVISQGAYLRFPSDRVAFLSFESFHGALTVNLDHRPHTAWSMQPGEEVSIEPGKVIFPSTGVSIDIPESEVWRPLPSEGRPRSIQEAHAYTQRLAQLVLAEDRSENGFAPLLGALLALDSPRPLTDEHRRVLPMLLELRQRIVHSQVDDIDDLLSRFSGIGRGLTPSSDDALVGLLLILNRMKNLLSPAQLDQLNRSAIHVSRLRTTALAANMVEAATLGAADEWLLHTADGILSGWPDEPTCARYLLWYGSSSGMDALVGMSLFYGGSEAHR